MDRQDETRDAQADQLAEDALHELGESSFDEPDEYAGQCDYAGCYPWLADVMLAYPAGSPLQAVFRDGGTDVEDWEFSA